MSTDDTYQGWTNWDTWDANLWLTNDEDAYRLATDCKDEFALNDLFELSFDDATTKTGFIDNIDPDRVNWAEIFASLHEGE